MSELKIFGKDSLATNAMGGTELMKYALAKRLPEDLLSNFQIFVSRVEDAFDETKIRLLWLQDLPNDPASAHLANGGWKNFHRIIFNSNWQMQAYIQTFNIPWSHCVVMQNCVEPFEDHVKPNDGTIRLAYWSTPHRGLNILVPVFNKLCEKHDNIELDVYSSFKIYGWEQRDKEFEPLFEQCRNHPKINYHGSVPNAVIRENLKKTHILAYPNTWPETSCITLIEAMAAGLMCVHPNYAVLYETAANWTHMYQWHEDPNYHASLFYNVLDSSIKSFWDEGVQSRLASQASYANVYYNWNVRAMQWETLLTTLLDMPRELPKPEKQFFKYNT
jgi:UDP-glucose:(glucosyl)LPS alpha-1,2-glucosyltransferase